MTWKSFSGQVGGDNFIYEVPQGIRMAVDFNLTSITCTRLSVAAKMHELGNKAQAFYKAKGKYPRRQRAGKNLVSPCLTKILLVKLRILSPQ